MLCSVLVNIDQQKKVSENILLSNFNLTEKKKFKKSFEPNHYGLGRWGVGTWTLVVRPQKQLLCVFP